MDQVPEVHASVQALLSRVRCHQVLGQSLATLEVGLLADSAGLVLQRVAVGHVLALDGEVLGTVQESVLPVVEGAGTELDAVSSVLDGDVVAHPGEEWHPRDTWE